MYILWKNFFRRIESKDISNFFVYEIENKQPVNRSFLKVYEVPRIIWMGRKGLPMPNVTKEFFPSPGRVTVQLSVDVTRCLYKSTKAGFNTYY